MDCISGLQEQGCLLTKIVGLPQVGISMMSSCLKGYVLCCHPNKVQGRVAPMDTRNNLQYSASQNAHGGLNNQEA
uniref:Uncharacterized protein n=1 Tax=Arundo donax TaxID=35708 RepID=A0A0A9FI39_ARUDO